MSRQQALVDLVPKEEITALLLSSKIGLIKVQDQGREVCVQVAKANDETIPEILVDYAFAVTEAKTPMGHLNQDFLLQNAEWKPTENGPKLAALPTGDELDEFSDLL